MPVTSIILNPCSSLLRSQSTGLSSSNERRRYYWPSIRNFQPMVSKSKKSKVQNSAQTKAELLFKVGKDIPKWYSIETSSTTTNEKYDPQKCEQIYRTECELYQQLYQKDQSSDYQWLQTSMTTTSKVNYLKL